MMSWVKSNKKKFSPAKTELLKARFMDQGRRMTYPARTSYTLIPNQKYRRSYRRSGKFSSTLDGDSPSLSTLGDFKALPLEIFQMVLEYLPVKDISMLSMVSKTISSRLINYISTPTGNRRLLRQDFHNPELSGCRKGSSILEHYKSLGLLLKRCTLLLPTKERLRYIHKILSETLTAGWDELECHRVYNFLCELSNLPRRVQTVVGSKPGSARKLELRIRIFCRSVLLNYWIHRSDSAFWLTRILKPWPMVNQARLLYILFGPASNVDGHVVWQKTTDGPADETSLKGLADAIKLLYDSEAKEWTADDVISLLDELAVVPRDWLLENSARLLILCGNNICFTFMASKAVNGRAIELARLVVFLALVCEKDLYCMDWAVKMMQKVCKVFSTPGERNNFLQSVENNFAHIIMDTLQSVISATPEAKLVPDVLLFFPLDHVIERPRASLLNVLIGRDCTGNSYLSLASPPDPRFLWHCWNKELSTQWHSLLCLASVPPHSFPFSIPVNLTGEHDEEDSSFLNLFHLVNAQANFHKEILYLAMSNSM